MNDTRRLFQMAAVALLCPVACAIGQELVVVRMRIVGRIEEVFNVVTHHLECALAWLFLRAGSRGEE